MVHLLVVSGHVTSYMFFPTAFRILSLLKNNDMITYILTDYINNLLLLFHDIKIICKKQNSKMTHYT